MLKKEKIYPTYVSQNNSNLERQVIYLMIPNGKEREQSKTLVTWAKSKERKAKS